MAASKPPSRIRDWLATAAGSDAFSKVSAHARRTVRTVRTAVNPLTPPLSISRDDFNRLRVAAVDNIRKQLQSVKVPPPIAAAAKKATAAATAAASTAATASARSLPVIKQTVADSQRSIEHYFRALANATNAAATGGAAAAAAADDKPRLYWSQRTDADGGWMKRVLDACSLLHEPFNVPVWLKNPHVSTVLAGPLRRPPPAKVVYLRDILPMSDGGVVQLDWYLPYSQPTAPPPSATASTVEDTGAAATFPTGTSCVGTYEEAMAGARIIASPKIKYSQVRVVPAQLPRILTDSRHNQFRAAAAARAATPAASAATASADSKSAAPPLSPESPVLVIFPGLTGGSNSIYIKQLAAYASESFGFHVCVFNYRGFGSELLTPRPSTSVEVAEIGEVLAHVRNLFPHSKGTFAVGYSMGANMLVKWMGKHHRPGAPPPPTTTPTPADGPNPPRPLLSGATSVSNAFDFVKLSNSLRKPFNELIYSRVLAQNVKKNVFAHPRNKDVLSQISGIRDIDYALKSQTIFDLDDRISRHVDGCPNLQTYYEQSSSLPYLPFVNVPLLCLNALDDPFAGVLPIDEVKRNPSIVLAVTPIGGHVSWARGITKPEDNYMSAVALQFFKATLNAGPRPALQPPTAETTASTATPNATSTASTTGGTLTTA